MLPFFWLQRALAARTSTDRRDEENVATEQPGPCARHPKKGEELMKLSPFRQDSG